MSSSTKSRTSKTVTLTELLKETWASCGDIEQASPLPELIVVDSLKKPKHFPYVVGLKEEYVELSDKEKESPPQPETTINVQIDRNEPKGIQVKGSMNTVHFSSAVMRLVNSYSTLTELKLIDCSLVAESMFMLSSSLKESSVTHLYLDENVIKGENYHVVLKENMTLIHLSLRMCRITDVGAKKLAENLKYSHPPRNLLKSLNLNGNLIGDEGITSIASALRWNMHLTSIVVAGNCFRDRGAKALAAILTPFALNKEEMRMRGERICEKLMKIKEYIDNRSNIPQLLPPTTEGKANDTPPKKSLKQSNKTSKDASVIIIPPKGTFNEAIEYYFEIEKKATEEVTDAYDPLVADVREVDKGTFSSRGNSTLWYINVSYNRLTVDSLRHFMNAVKYQQDEGKGLGRFEFEGNYFDESDPVIEELRKLFEPHKSEMSFEENPE